MASMEIAKALKDVPLRSSSEDEIPLSHKRPDSDVVEIETVPRREVPGRSHPHSQLEEDMEPVSMYTNSSSPPRSIHAQYEDPGPFDNEEDAEDGYDSEESNVARVLREARMRRAELSSGGYFYKHPDRKPQPPRPSVDSVGSQYADDDDDDASGPGLAYEEEEEEPQPPELPAAAPKPAPTSPSQGGVRPLPSVPVPPKPPAPSSIPVPINPVPSIRQQAQNTGKTAALIEMYREREKDEPVRSFLVFLNSASCPLSLPSLTAPTRILTHASSSSPFIRLCLLFIFSCLFVLSSSLGALGSVGDPPPEEEDEDESTVKRVEKSTEEYSAGASFNLVFGIGL